jgi:CBS domain-containing protein
MLQAEAAMTKDVLAVPTWMTLGELEGLFETRDFNGFPVVEGRQLVGMMTKFDFLKAFIFTPDSIVPRYDELMKRTVEETMTRQVCTVHATTPLTRVLQMMVERRNQCFPVVDENDDLVGIISRGDIVRALRG